VPNLTIYIRGSPTLCYERIQKANNPDRMEELLTMTLLQQLHDEHEAWLLDPELRATPLKTRRPFKSVTDYPRHNCAVMVVNGHQSTSEVFEDVVGIIWAHYDSWIHFNEDQVLEPHQLLGEIQEQQYTSPEYYTRWWSLRDKMLKQTATMTHLSGRIMFQFPHLEDKYKSEELLNPYERYETVRERKEAKRTLRRQAFMTALQTRPYLIKEAQEICKTPCPRFQGKPKCLCEVYHLPQYAERTKNYLICLYSKELANDTLAHLKKVPHDCQDGPEEEAASQGSKESDEEWTDDSDGEMCQVD
jgi:hypothetical protein